MPQNDKIYKVNLAHSKMIQKMCIKHTFTICGAAASADMPRQQSTAISGVRASQTPSLLIISLPPAEDSCTKRNEAQKQELNSPGKQKKALQKGFTATKQEKFILTFKRQQIISRK